MLKEREKLLQLEDVLSQRVVGQDDAIAAVANAIRISRAGLHPHNRPQGVFMLLGPSGVGKTELAKTVADALYEGALLRIDMSEYMEQHSVSRLLGAAPGLIGYGEGGQLTEAVRRRPFQVVLLDEVEKAHREITNILLQVFDEGHLTDSMGHKVDFRNTIVILTSNLGAADLAHDESLPQETRADVMRSAARSHFAPEFINRLDDLIVFRPLTRESMRPIADIQLKAVSGMLAGKRVRLTATDAAREWIAEAGFDPQYGARPLKRVVHTAVLEPLSRALLSGAVTESSHVRVGTQAEYDAGQLPGALLNVQNTTRSHSVAHSHREVSGEEEEALVFTVEADDVVPDAELDGDDTDAFLAQHVHGDADGGASEGNNKHGSDSESEVDFGGATPVLGTGSSGGHHGGGGAQSASSAASAARR